jgi:predicted RecA/RadA family phage recombinase
MSTLQTKGNQGYSITYTAPTGGLTSNDVVIVRSGTSGFCGIVENTVAVGDTAVVWCGRQARIPKLTTTGNSFAKGALVYRDASTGSATATATANTLIGACTSAAALADTYVWVKFTAD